MGEVLVPKKKEVIKKWSYSRYSMYAQCPAQFHWHYILKMPRDSSPALQRGIDIHAKAENFVNGKITGMPKELEKFSNEFKALKREFKKKRGYCEPDISTNMDGTPAEMKTTNYFIGFADFFHNPPKDDLTVIDYKTGRWYASHKSQGHAYSTFLLQQNPEQEKINVEFWYLDSGDVTEFSFTQDDLPSMLSLWERRIDKMYADKKYIKTPHKFCNWCAKKKAGKCNG